MGMKKTSFELPLIVSFGCKNGGSLPFLLSHPFTFLFPHFYPKSFCSHSMNGKSRNSSGHRETNGTQMKTQKPISPFRLSSLLRLEKDPKLALQLFLNPNPSSSEPPKPFRYSLLSYDLIISKLGRAKMFDEMEEILQQLKQETRFAPHEVIFCNVIAFYGRARLPDRAFQVFERIPTFRCKRTVKSVNSLLDALLKSREFGKMMEVLVGIGNHGSPDACTFNILIHAACLCGDLDAVWGVFDEMRKRGVQPNVVTFGTLIYGLSLNSKLKEALRLKEDMVRVYMIKPNASIYTTLIKGFCGVGELNFAFKLKEEMVTSKVKLDSKIYSTLISALFKHGRKEEVSDILREMGENGCKPDTATYNAMINGHCKENDLESANRVVDEMVEKGCKPDVISFNTIIGGLCKEGKLDKAMDLLEDMPRRGCPPDVLSYRIVFDGLCEMMQLKEATSILDEMIFKGYVPRNESINKLVDRLCQECNMELLWMVLNSLGRGNRMNMDTWARVVAFLYKENLLESSNLIDSLIS
ncbi:putative pentatricopeptide repeat-containing protein At1g53330 [Cucumis melo]|uniref:Pentatricopeptide repeat-containing protein At1g53330 n=3 Tax=Cucumis melo TaxID=3656 RepID=A0A1S3BT71_CUCME|nr:putative pentatricopeptide repeat-containing protein At1g53330 [Cucumis melo]